MWVLFVSLRKGLFWRKKKKEQKGFWRSVNFSENGKVPREEWANAKCQTHFRIFLFLFLFYFFLKQGRRP